MTGLNEIFHAKRARRYDDAIAKVIPGYEFLHAMAGQFVRSAVGEEARVLVVGAGTGAEIEAFGRRYPGWRFTACDPCEEMLAVAAKRLAAAGLLDRVEARAVPCQDLPVAKPFDAAVCLLVSHFLADDGARLALFRSIAAHLRQGAPLTLADMYQQRESTPRQSMIPVWLDWQRAQGFPEAEIVKGLRHVERDIHLISESRLDALLAEAGFGPPQRFFGAFLFAGYLASRV